MSSSKCERCDKPANLLELMQQSVGICRECFADLIRWFAETSPVDVTQNGEGDGEA